MKAMVFDIETVPAEEHSFSDKEWEYILKYAENEEDEEKTRERLSLWALTAHLVSVAFLKVEDRDALVLYISDEDSTDQMIFEDLNVYMKSFSLREGLEEAEAKMLSEFWKIVDEKKGDYRFVSFNGRRFDVVFLMLRSFVLGVEAKVNLLDKRYDHNTHLDLLDALTFYGQGRKYSLDFLCRRLGLPSPKEEVDGHEVKNLFRDGRYMDIAIYNLKDVVATDRIYRRFKETLGTVFGL